MLIHLFGIPEMIVADRAYVFFRGKVEGPKSMGESCLTLHNFDSQKE